MLVFGFAAGLPYTLLIGTLNAWLGAWEIDLATIGVVLSWIGLLTRLSSSGRRWLTASGCLGWSGSGGDGDG
jgi:hypothetical protein